MAAATAEIYGRVRGVRRFTRITRAALHTPMPRRLRRALIERAARHVGFEYRVGSSTTWRMIDLRCVRVDDDGYEYHVFIARPEL